MRSKKFSFVVFILIIVLFISIFFILSVNIDNNHLSNSYLDKFQSNSLQKQDSSVDIFEGKNALEHEEVKEDEIEDVLLLNINKILEDNPDFKLIKEQEIKSEKENKNKEINHITYELLLGDPNYSKAFPHSFNHLQFIHVPKCGGTTFSSLLRQFQCLSNPQYHSDCCIGVAFCDPSNNVWCKSIMGCYDHGINSNIIDNPFFASVSILREPVSRLISAWFYKGHSPNIDFFHVRPEFANIRKGLAPKKTFEEYLEMPEYNNIMTRMFGASSFPYRNITITEEIYQVAVEKLKKLYFLGIQEEYSLSTTIFSRMYFRDHALYHSYIEKTYKKIDSSIDIKNKNEEIITENGSLFDQFNQFDFNSINLDPSELDFIDKQYDKSDIENYKNLLLSTRKFFYPELPGSLGLNHNHNKVSRLQSYHFYKEESPSLIYIPSTNVFEDYFLQFLNIDNQISATRKSSSKEKLEILNDPTLMERIKEVNSYDIRLYQEAINIFCSHARQYPDIYEAILRKGKIQCENGSN